MKPPFIIAVSGGVDSVVLLDILHISKQSLVIAHVNHGIRSDSDEDEAFVKQLAHDYNLPFESTKLSLGSQASEEMARLARYDWLEQVRAKYRAVSIITAHHQDDVLETMLINISRGTGWRGICSLRNTFRYHRPLLAKSKTEIVAYAIENKLSWREDSTNDTMQYLRNRVRNLLIPRLTPTQRSDMIDWYKSQLSLRRDIEHEVADLLTSVVFEKAITRYVLIMTDAACGRELLRAWLGESLESSRLDDLLLFAKTALPGAKWSLNGSRFVVADKQRLIVLPPRD